MSGALPQVYLIRHGETAWTISGQHTGRTDIALTEQGERDAQALSVRLKSESVGKVADQSTATGAADRRAGRFRGSGAARSPI